MIPQPRYARTHLLVGLAALACSACGQNETQVPVYAVKGQALFRNQPMTNALVIFHPVNDRNPNAPRPTGRVGADGWFTLSTFALNDGAPAGEYSVTVLWPMKKEGEEDDDDGQHNVDQLQGHFSDPRTSSLRRQIKAEENKLEAINLDG